LLCTAVYACLVWYWAKTNLVGVGSSGHILPNLGLPNPLPHSPQGSAKATNSHLADNTLPPNRRRRSNNNSTKFPNQHALQWRPPAPIARRRNDEPPRRGRPR
jgi:hypothetical protein